LKEISEDTSVGVFNDRQGGVSSRYRSRTRGIRSRANRIHD